MFQDNKSTVALENNWRASSPKRTKHIKLRYFFIKISHYKKKWNKILPNRINVVRCHDKALARKTVFKYVGHDNELPHRL